MKKRDFSNEVLEEVNVTRGHNGYPWKVYEAVIFDYQEDLQEFSEWCGKPAVLLRKRDGWALYEKLREVELPYVDEYEETGLPPYEDDTHWRNDGYEYQLAVID